MSDYGPETYGERIADVYDDWYVRLGNAEEQADLLAELADGGPALELGIGTGRVALPLAARGVEVHGIDASPAIVAKLREKSRGDAIPVTIGDMADVPVDGKFALIYVVFNTFFMLTSQEAQLRCLRNIVSHLAPGGRFFIHAFVPDTTRMEHGQKLSVGDMRVDQLRLDATKFDVSTQRIDTTQLRITEEGIRLVYAQMRFVYVPELDVMAQLAGLTLENRWSTFDKQPFTSESAFAASVYRA